MVNRGASSRPAPLLARRNATIIAASTMTLGLVMLYPTSTNGGTHRGPGPVRAKAGFVSGPGAAPGRGQPAVGATPAPGTEAVVNGNSIDTFYGPVQVQLHVRAGRILAATAIDYPQGTGRDVEINGYAIPVLQQETVAAQSARVDTVSGATYTSDGYVQSLQSALDLAHLR